MRNNYKNILYLFLIMHLTAYSNALAFGLKDVYKNLHINNTAPGNYRDAAAGWYSGGSSVIRTKNTAINPFSVTPPSISSSCNGIDAHFGSFSMISMGELVDIANNIGSQAAVYAFHLGMKTFAPQIENILKDIRNLTMELNQFGIDQCKITQSAFAAMLPQDTVAYETVCNEMNQSGGGKGIDLGGQRKRCNTHQKLKDEARKAQEKDPELLMDNYNLFISAAKKIGITKDMHSSLMSLVGTIIVKDGIVTPYPSLVTDTQSWNAHINGGDNASEYICLDDKCLTIDINKNKSISRESSYSGLAASKLNHLKNKMVLQESDFTSDEEGFIDSLGAGFPIFDHITIEASSGVSILDGSSQIVARYMILVHLKSIVSEIRKGISLLRQKQINEKYLTEYDKSLQELLDIATNEWVAVLNDADRINKRADIIEKHLIAIGRG